MAVDPGSAYLATNIGSNLFNVGASKSSNFHARKMMQIQQEYTRENMSYAHQREVGDLKAAGLNPILSAGGGGPSGSAPSQAPIVTPQITAPDILAVEQLRQNQQRINNETMATTAGIAKTMSDTDLNKMKKILLKKGMIRAELEGEASTVMQRILRFMREQWNTNNPPTNELNNIMEAP